MHVCTFSVYKFIDSTLTYVILMSETYNVFAVYITRRQLVETYGRTILNLFKR